MIQKKRILIGSILILCVGGIVFGGYRFYHTIQELKQTQELARQAAEQARIEKANFEKTILELQGTITRDTEEKINLGDALAREQGKNNIFESQIRDISGSVAILEKLNTIDQELLEKYSKVYFLNEHYVPVNLSPIPTSYLTNTKSNLEIHAKVVSRLTQMLDEARKNSLDLSVVSAYRSFTTQNALKTSYKIMYGSGANRFSADQGYSEHQLGTTVDLTTSRIREGLTIQFEKTPESIWLQNNAHRFGFTLSYPKNNVYYQFEPWHWRFVGVDLATRLFQEKKYFYDMDQRTINEYRIKLFE